MTAEEFQYPSCEDVCSIVVTNSREVAARKIECGYTLFTVPQLFGTEQGQIVLIREKGYTKAQNGMSVLEKYESDARLYSSGGVK